MNPTLTLAKRIGLPLLAGGLTALVLPWSSASAGQEPAFSGYNAKAWAAPVQVEFYEPTIPIPATPQFEVLLAYSTVEAETGIASGRGSWLWPGDPVGEGAKTFAEAIGLPEEIAESGYPVQVNSVWPTGPEEQKDEPFPGTIMRTSAQEEGVGAHVGYSPDGEGQEPEPQNPGAPEVPGLPAGGDSVQDSLEAFGDAITGSSTAAAEEPEEPEGGSPVPPELAALVDFTGYTSQSHAETGDAQVTTYARSAMSDVSLIEGLVTIEGLRTRTVTTSDGDRATADGGSALGTMAIAGNEFTIGPNGVEASGEQSGIPGLPDDAKAALRELGLTFSVPKPDLQAEGDAAESLVHGLVVEIDVVQLREQLKDVPLNQIVDQVPDETGDLKSFLQAVANLSPRIVITLGNAATLTDTVQPLEVPPVPTPTGGSEEPGETAGGGASGGGGGDLPAPDAGPAAPGAPADAASGSGTGTLTNAQPVGDGLPPLNSIPGALTVGGIIAATAAGTWLRKIGAVALGGAGTCPHGLDSGLPDLRKA